MSVPSKAAASRYVVSIALLGVLYTALVFLTAYTVKTWPDSPWKYAVGILPAVPLALGWPTLTRFFRAQDEMHRKIAGEALQTAFGITALVTFAYGWLQFAGLPAVNLSFVFPFMWIAFVVCYALSYRRYGG